MDLPPQRIYLSQHDLARDLAIHAAIGGYKFIIRRSTIECSGRSTIVYACNQFRRGCKFSIVAKEDAYEMWHLKHRTDEFAHHNHSSFGPKGPPRKPPIRASRALIEAPAIEPKLPTCSKCHIEGHRRGAKCCILRDQESP
jgi:hypothetical protein